MRHVYACAIVLGISAGFSAALTATSLPKVNRPTAAQLRESHRKAIEEGRRLNPDLDWPDRSHLLPSD